jgi:hypothetical protein
MPYNFKIVLFAIAFSPFLLNAELRDDFDENEEQVAYDNDGEDTLADTSYSAELRDDFDENEEQVAYDDDEEGYLADTSYSDDSYSQGQDQEASCHSPYHRMHFGVRHTEARGVGYRDGYTTLEGFGIYDHNPNFMPFLDLRGHVFNNGKLAGNVGIGERTVLSSINHIFGVYLYYDVRQENHRFTVNSLSPGIELLGKRMEYRMNGYFPVGGNHSYKYGYQFDKFHGNHILLRQKQKFAMKGGDAEIGTHITQSTRYDLYAGAGPYYFAAGGAHAWGGKVRLLGRYKEYVSLEASYSYDRTFRNIVQGTVGFNYPFGKKLSRKDRNCPQQNDLALSRAAFAPYRFEIPVVKTIKKNVKALNPATGKPWQVWFVNNTSSSNGTFESPFSTLFAASNASDVNDMIYVFPGDGTTKGMTTGIVLQNGQQLFGSGISHRITTAQGKITIPAFSTTSPTITNTASIITLANGNEVSGMNIAVTTAGINAIDGTAGINGVSIDRNSISGTVAYNAISVLGIGSLEFTNNNLIAPIDTSGASNGITSFIQQGGFAKIDIEQNTISGYSKSIVAAPAPLFPSTATGEILIANNVGSNFGLSGISCATGMPNTLTQILSNTLFDTGSQATVFTDSAAIAVSRNNLPNAGTCLISNNTIVSTNSNPAISGILTQLNLPNLSSAQMLIENNTVQVGTGAGSIGINVRMTSTASGTLCASITDNQVSLQAPSGTNGISISTGPLGIVDVQDFSGNIAPSISTSGNVILVAPGSCNQNF